ncbi:MAG TPA: HIT domain-containing protein [Anaerolineales bacterium]|nr:HIT domain-containing protein [Anaerolineales bacterium]
MNNLYTPWRLNYLQGTQAKIDGCFFCVYAAQHQDVENLIVYRGETCFIILNRYPYNNGHALIVPYTHISDLPDLPANTLNEMMQLSQKLIRAFQALYRPHGYNVGMNLGEAAGAGVPGHLHLHVLPRWLGDASFMGTVGETRVLPEELHQTQARLAQALAGT